MFTTLRSSCRQTSVLLVAYYSFLLLDKWMSVNHIRLSLPLLYFFELFMKRIVDSVDVNNWHLSRILLSCARLSFPFLPTLRDIVAHFTLWYAQLAPHQSAATLQPQVAVAGLAFFPRDDVHRPRGWIRVSRTLELILSRDRNSIQLASRKSCHLRTKMAPKRRIDSADRFSPSRRLIASCEFRVRYFVTSSAYILSMEPHR